MPLIWAPLAPTHPLGQAIGLRESIHVPFFAETDAAARSGAARDPKDLLFGLLIGYNESPPTLDMSAIRPRYRPALEALARGFRFDSLEQSVLNVAATLRGDGHPGAARSVLATGRTLFPTSAPIASDAVMDLWSLATEAPAPERAALWADIHAAASGLDYAAIRPDARESIAFMHFVAVRCLGDADAIERVLHDEVFEHVEARGMKVKIKQALEDPTADPAYLYA